MSIGTAIIVILSQILCAVGGFLIGLDWRRK